MGLPSLRVERGRFVLGEDRAGLIDQLTDRSVATLPKVVGLKIARELVQLRGETFQSGGRLAVAVGELPRGGCQLRYRWFRG